jgi:Uma2 family endonuclease
MDASKSCKCQIFAINGLLGCFLDEFVRPLERGLLVQASLPVRLGRGKFREPDISYIEKRRIKDMHTPPEGADLLTKRRDYAKADVRESWIVDPEEKTITVLALSSKAFTVHGVFKEGEDAASKLLKGFKVAVSDVFAAGEGK